MPDPRFTIADVVTGGVLADVLRLEVATDPDGLVNLVANPDGSLGGYGWVAPVNGTLVRSASTNGPAVEFVTGSAVATYFTTENMPVTAGQYVAAQWDERGTSATVTQKYYRARFEFIDAAGALVSSSAPTGYLLIGDTGTRTYAATVVPAGATRCRLRFDLYSSTSGAVPEANKAWRLTNVSVAKAATSAALSSVTTNYVSNPSFETNLDGWTATAGNIARVSGSAAFGSYRMEVAKPSGASARVQSNTGPVTPGKDYQAYAHFAAAAATTSTVASITLEWLDASGTVVGSVANSTFVMGLTTAWRRIGISGTAPAGASAMRAVVGASRQDGAAANIWVDAVSLQAWPSGVTAPDYFDGATTDTATATYDWTGTAHASTSTRSTASVGNLPPIVYTNVIGPTHEIKVTRGALNVGTLAAEILDADLDPAVGDLIRPGRAVRLRALDQAGAWNTVYTGTLTAARVTYHLLEDVPDAKRARVALAAVDNVATLAAAARPSSVATIAELPYVLEGCGVPWNVNGSGAQVGTAVVRANSDQATALDQVAMTRDTAHGYAWVDQVGVCQAWNAANMPATNVLTLDESVYTDADVSFDTDECINEVDVVVRGIDTTGETVETTTTYVDATSISTWGRHRASFTVLAPTNPATFAAEVLAANGTPQVRINGVKVNVRDETFLPVALLDLYDRVRLVNTDKAIDHPARLSTLEHTITPDAWIIEVGFTDVDSVAAPQVVPPLQDGNAPFTQVGTATFAPQTITQGSGVFVTVTFPTPYAAAPTVMATLSSGLGGTGRLVPRVLNVTATTARIYLYNAGSVDATFTGSPTVAWLAYGA